MLNVTFTGEDKADVCAQMEDYLNGTEAAANADGTPATKRVRRTKEQIAKDNAAAIQAAAAGSSAPAAPAAPTPITSAPSVVHTQAQVMLTLEQAQAELKRAVGILGEKEGPVIIHGVLTKEFGVERTKDLPEARRGEFVMRLAQLTAPKPAAPAAPAPAAPALDLM